MRRAFICLATLGLAGLGLTSLASATPVVTFKATAVPIPGYPHTGNILGAGAALQSEFTISGTEYGGFPPPVVAVNVPPVSVFPDTTGRAVFTGLPAPAVVTGPTLALVAWLEPALFDAVTVTDTICPASEEESVSVWPVVPSDHW